MDALSSNFLSSRCAIILSRTSRLTGSAVRLLYARAAAELDIQKPEPQQTTTRRQTLSRVGNISKQSEHTLKHCLAMHDVTVFTSVTVNTMNSL